MHKIFIDGEHGTTGLQIHQLLKSYHNMKILSLDKDKYKDLQHRLELAKMADITILCLPDEAAIEMANSLAKQKRDCRIIDCSTAHRVDDNWVYGFPQLTKGQKQLIKNANFVSNPGCYPTGALSLIRPLIDSGALSKEAFLTIHAVSGYSGGGKNLIKQMTEKSDEAYIDLNYFSYALQLDHKHNAEIKKYSLLQHQPVFLPNVGRFLQGMMVNIGLHFKMLQKSSSMQDIYQIFLDHYQDENNIEIVALEDNAKLTRLDPTLLANSNKLRIHIFNNKENGTVNLCALLDNLGKGASGAAIENLLLMLEN